MSVWKSACYRDDTLQWYLRQTNDEFDDSPFVHSLCDFDIGDFGHFPVPEGLHSGNFKTQAKENIPLIRKLQGSRAKYISHSLALNAKEWGEAIVGIKAVYQIAAKIIKRVLNTENQEFGNKDFYNSIIKYGFAASSHSAGDFGKRAKAIKEITEGKLAIVKTYIREIVRLRGFHKAKSYAADIREAEATFGKYPQVPDENVKVLKNWTVWSVAGGLVLRDEVDNRLYVILSNDVERIDRVCSGVFLSKIYLLGYGDVESKASKEIVAAYDKMIDLFLDVASLGNNANEICRAFDVAYHYVLASQCAVDDDRAHKEQIKKWVDEDLGKIFDINYYSRIVKSLKPKEKIEICMFYKCLPQPDFDYFSAAKRQLDMYVENVEAAMRDRAASGEMFDEILKYHKWTMLYAFWDKHGKCPGFVKDGVEEKHWHIRYPHVKATDIDFTEMNDIDFNGDFLWRGRKHDILDLVNDKAICPNNLKDSDSYSDVMQKPISDRNQLADVMMRNTPINLEELGRNRDAINYDVKADDKPESKKPNGRWFFEAGTEARLKQSEYEDSVAEYARHVVGCFSGKSNADKIRQMNAITAPIHPDVPFQALYVSFDIKKFSPYLPLRVHQALDEQWAEAFGVDDLRQASRIFSHGLVHYLKGAIHHIFPKVGVDFEGFAGRKLTVYHCAVMGFAARQLRRKKVTHTSCRFASLIDDGLLRIALPKDNFLQHKQNALQIVEDVYAVAALRISWDKTYASSIVAVFLHEIRMAGRSITPGLRAILKVSNRSDAAVPSMLDDLLHLRSTCSGAITSGALPTITYIIYLYFVMDLIEKWAPKHSKIHHSAALLCFAPIQIGGLGLESMTSLSGSLSQSQFADCIGRLKLIGFRYKDVRVAITSILNTELVNREGIAKLTNPAGVKTHTTILRSDRLQITVERHLLKVVSAPVVQALVPVLEAENLGFLKSAIDCGARMPIPLREALYDMTPHSLVRKIAAKFLRARTAKTLVPFRIFVRIGYANARDAETVLNRFVL